MDSELFSEDLDSSQDTLHLILSSQESVSTPYFFDC